MGQSRLQEERPRRGRGSTKQGKPQGDRQRPRRAFGKRWSDHGMTTESRESEASPRDPGLPE
jgi:hypothetical protein